MELRTDFLPGREFVSVETRVDEGTPEATPATARDDFLEGAPIGEFDGLAPGTRSVEVVLRDADGTAFYTERVLVTLRADFGLRILISRDCADRACPSDQRCLAGSCVPLTCGGEADLAECGDPVCVDVTDCSATYPACAEPVCTTAACLWRFDDGACSAGERCDVVDGCVPRTTPGDGGAADAADAGECSSRADCPADTVEDGACQALDVDGCGTMGSLDRTFTEWDCAERRCAITLRTDPVPCTASSREGMGCSFGGGDTACARCRSGVCTPLDGGACADGIMPGGCRGGVCCVGCWSGAGCVSPPTDTQCGSDGMDCTDCTTAGQTCDVMLLAGGGTCT